MEGAQKKAKMAADYDFLKLENRGSTFSWSASIS